jgi:hypothetical protein
VVDGFIQDCFWGDMPQRSEYSAGFVETIQILIHIRPNLYTLMNTLSMNFRFLTNLLNVSYLICKFGYADLVWEIGSE